MSTPSSSTIPSNQTDERQPLLGSRTGSAHIGVESDPEAAAPANDPNDAEAVAKKVSYWRTIWYLVFAASGGVVLAGIIKGFVENGDVEVDFMTVIPTSLCHSPAAYVTHSLTSIRL